MFNRFIKSISCQGYRLVPGDKCKGGFLPPRQVKVLKKSCAQVNLLLFYFNKSQRYTFFISTRRVFQNFQAEVKQSRYGVDRKLFLHNKIHSRPLRTFITTLVVIATLLSLGFAGYVFYKRRKRSVKALFELHWELGMMSYYERGRET